ncbi:bifunctional diguanylate cyclase/phosphodiesterase [Planococcus salinus]|uniref:Bifunctional diguanylate cyclase/phosphodiesterase n=1 Tax=Planococcus salinus TaxID=1848460 RepID=A0A3M8P536_9BACL|nr:bifunctional diguanylate cyclase/phosphodiesterase [Planococcus salinus]RNF38783.1 bifunctional diguanylate cyclase/phosphodiesterase [Planococcus salinus]
METVTFSYDFSLILLSIFVAVFTSLVALDISTRLADSEGIRRFRWIGSGAIVLGLGTWAMHFIAMLAFQLDMEVTYDISMVIISIIPALLACGIAFYTISKPSPNRLRLVIAALFIGTGIISMHYFGMEAMQMPASITYDPFLWVLSVIIAYATSLIALYLLFSVQQMSRFHWQKVAAAVIMAGAVVGMHYTGMAAAMFSPDAAHPHAGHASISSPILAYAIGISMLMILILASVNVRVDQKISARTAESERKFQSVIESANDAIIVSDSNGNILQWNQGAQTIFGYAKEEVLGLNLDLIVPDQFKTAHRQGMARYLETKKPRVIGKTVELTGLRKDGTEFPFDMSLGAWETNKGIFFSSIIRDITERKATEKEISNLVYLDSLTGLPNRHLFNDRLASALRQSKENDAHFSLLSIDLDYFKLVNDTFGHAIGDLLLVEVTKQLQLITTDTDTVSRLGGDEFILLLPGTDYEKAATQAKLILDQLSEPFHIDGEEVFITPSIGISMYPADGNDQDSLIKHADMAMYRVKEEGKNSFQFFKQEMNDSVSRKSRLATGLRKGLEQGEFFLQYQPQIDIKTERIIGVEALIRWEHPEWGIVSPADFIPVAEETGIIVQLGEYVLHTACRQNKAWQDAGLPPFRVAVNISARQFSQSNLAATVSQALDQSGLDPKYLELELTESIIQGASSAVTAMKELKSMGLHLSIDDFGTGYSSLSYLKLFPIDTLKIDQYFTRNIQADTKDAALVDTIIRMAHNLELNVIAEGVETDEQLAFLRQRHCDQAQGYYFNKPLLPADIERLYRLPVDAEAPV